MASESGEAGEAGGAGGQVKTRAPATASQHGHFLRSRKRLTIMPAATATPIASSG